ncbi:hypothetical protein NP493_294g03031 [Ridgeia piscesae]|uniref:Calponin-homology (CH) domain-containing protein n=1 Tax=Ridgeia piscesae TaxID=27915 RepID=A0AAD9UC53_RIDPI|nr:hypothetical protein NP493_294g03031 [Ridgeia piscesae]
MELDVSCNELTHLPVQIGDVQSLRRLNVRCNRLVELPQEISQLSLETLDCSSNKITHLPLAFRNMDMIERLLVADNPLVSPPAQLCSRGRVHITKYLQNEAAKEDRQRGILSEVDMRTVYRQPASLPHPISNGVKYPEYPMDKRKYRQAVDSGYRSTDSLEKCRWSPSNCHSNSADSEPTHLQSLHPVERSHEKQPELRQDIVTEPLAPPGDTSPTTSLKSFASLSSDCWSFVSAVENPNKPTSPDFSTLTSQSSFNSHRSLRSPTGQTSPERTSLDLPVLPGSPQVQRSPVVEMSEPHNCRSSPLQNSSWNSTSVTQSPSTSKSPYDSSPSPVTNCDPFAGYKVEPQDGLLDEFTRELQRQKSEYEAKKAAAAELRRQIEQEDEERRTRERQKAVRNLQDEEEDAAGREREREERRRAAVRVQEEQKALMERQREGARREGRCRTASSSAPNESRRVGLSQSFKEPANSQHTYKRTVSETPHTRYGDARQQNKCWCGHSISSCLRSGTGRSVNRQNSYVQAVAPDEEFRLRRDAMVSQQRHEAQMVRRRMEEDKHWIKKMQKDAVYGYVNRQRTHHGKVDDDIPHSHDTSLNSSFTNSTDGTSSPPPNFDDSNGSMNSHISQMLPETCRRKLEAMSDELNSLNPAFTIRRQYQQAQEEREHIDLLRQIIESRLKVVLPEDLPSALRDGVVLCHLANHLRPRSVASIHVPSHAAPKLSMAKCRKNVDSFLMACRDGHRPGRSVHV